jgi:hypothetical protein
MSTAEASSAAEHHVKFNIQEEEFKNHHENLEIVQQSSNVFNVNLGYLKVDHNYKITFSLNLSALNTASSDNLKYLPDKSSKHVILKEFHQEASDKKLYTFTVVFNAFKEKHDLETVYFSLNNNHHHQQVVLHFEAKVLGQHQGTQLLRNGITLLHHQNGGEKSHFNIN